MIHEGISNAGHSVFQRLLNKARENGEDFGLLLSRYGVERFLYRIGESSYTDWFVLKGASKIYVKIYINGEFEKNWISEAML